MPLQNMFYKVAPLYWSDLFLNQCRKKLDIYLLNVNDAQAHHDLDLLGNNVSGIRIQTDTQI